MTKKLFRLLISVFAIIIGLYPVIYFIIDRKFGLLSTKTNELLLNLSWNIGFYFHIIFGGLALLIGWLQFSPKIRLHHSKFHKLIGKAYIISVFLSSIAGFYLAFYATGGIIASLGFIGLSMIWFYTTLTAYLNIRNSQIEQHQSMMIYSYAACFSAVTLRVWLPLLSLLFSNFDNGYRLTAWICWIPNLVVANQIIRRIEGRRILFP